MWTTNEREQIFVNAIEGVQFYHMHGKLEENVFVNKKREKNSFDESPPQCVCVCVCVCI